MRSLFSTSLILLMMLTFSLHAQTASNAACLINGHKYDLDDDLFFREIQEWYDANLDSIGLENLVDSLAQANNITVAEFNFPLDVDLVYLEDTTNTYDIMGKITLAPWTLKANGIGCDFECQVSEMGILFSTNNEFIDGKLNITESHTETYNPIVTVTGTGGFLCPILADTLEVYLSSWLNGYLDKLTQDFADISGGELFDILNPIQSMQVQDPELIKEAFDGFPMNMKIKTLHDPSKEVTQLVLIVDFLTGTTEDRNAFSEIIPDDIPSPGLQYGGFSYLYWVLQRGFSWHTEWLETQRVEKAFGIMADNNILDYRLEIRWHDLQKKAYLGESLHPDSLSVSEIEPLLNDVAHWDTSVFTGIQKILSSGYQQNLKPFLTLGVGHQDRMPDDGSGRLIAPALPGWIGPENYTGVNANEFLYNLKIYAHAVVSRFADQIDIWQIENELNAAGFAAADSTWWRKGDLWRDQNFRDRVWRILVDAVRTEDPSARITHDLHMLGFMPAMESWLEDMDIVGVNFYPNQTGALPVMGFVVGEYIWAVRRVLKGLGYPDKPVWLIETGYPGIEINDISDSLLLQDDMLYFSEKRQADFIETALLSAVKNGVNGFFYYALATEENMSGDIPGLNKYIRYAGLVRGETDQPKPGLSVFASQINNLATVIHPENRTHINPRSAVLYQNYPNPFNPSTVISWQLAINSHVELSVYNLLGQKMVTLFSGNMNAGNHSYRFNGKDLASGIYFYQLVVGDPSTGLSRAESRGSGQRFREVMKMILLR